MGKLEDAQVVLLDTHLLLLPGRVGHTNDYRHAVNNQASHIQFTVQEMKDGSEGKNEHQKEAACQTCGGYKE